MRGSSLRVGMHQVALTSGVRVGSISRRDALKRASSSQLVWVYFLPISLLGSCELLETNRKERVVAKRGVDTKYLRPQVENLASMGNCW
jgi:hypothetical protein